MRFLIDECCDKAIKIALQNEGFNIRSMNELNPGAEDSIVLNLALNEKRNDLIGCFVTVQIGRIRINRISEM